MSSSITFLNVAILLAYVVNIVMTYVASTGIFGNTIMDLSTKYQILINPAGWAFSIWSLIYLTEALFCLTQLVFSKYRSSPLTTSTPVAAGWIAACLFQSSWVVAYCQEQLWLSAFLLFFVWVSLAVVLRAQEALVSAEGVKLPVWEYLLLIYPFRLHFAWMTAATVVGFNVVALRTEPSCQLAIAAISLIVLGLIAGYLHNNHTVSAVLAWSTAAIASYLHSPPQAITDRFGSLVTDGVKGACEVSAVLLGILSLITILRRGWEDVQPRTTAVALDSDRAMLVSPLK